MNAPLDRLAEPEPALELSSTQRMTASANRVREQVLDIHRSFAPLRKVLGEVGLLALNASVACARLGQAGRTFATVARDLHSTSVDLSNRIDDVEGAFHEAARLVVRWTLAEQRAEALRAATRATALRRGQPMQNKGLPIWTAEAGARWRARSVDSRVSSAERHFATLLLVERDALLSAMFELTYLIGGLERHVDRIRWAAVRQTRYLRVLASIERAHLHEQAGAVDAVVAAMEHLDQRISALEEAARDKVLGLTLHSRAFERAQSAGG